MITIEDIQELVEGFVQPRFILIDTHIIDVKRLKCCEVWTEKGVVKGTELITFDGVFRVAITIDEVIKVLHDAKG